MSAADRFGPEPDAAAEPRLIDHLIELRARLLRSVIGLLVVFAALMPFASDLYGLFAQPLLATLPSNGQLVAVDPADPDCWFVSAAPGPFHAHGARESAQAALYRWRREGPWEELDLGLPRPLETMPYALAATGEGLVAALSDGRLFGSGDQGDNWQPVEADGLTKVVAMAARNSLP